MKIGDIMRLEQPSSTHTRQCVMMRNTNCCCTSEDVQRVPKKDLFIVVSEPIMDRPLNGVVPGFSVFCVGAGWNGYIYIPRGWVESCRIVCVA